MIKDASKGYRRVVPSPDPIKIVETEMIRTIIDQGILVVAAGGGGIPVVREGGMVRGVDAVIDKDRASMLLAIALAADLLVFSTDADHVYLRFRQPDQRALRLVRLEEMRGYHQAGEFPPGSMGPKVEAAMNFLAAGGKKAVITSLDNLTDAVLGDAGTRIVP